MSNIVNLSIKLNPIDYSIEKYIKKKSIIDGEYGKMEDKNINKIVKSLKSLKIKNIKTLIHLIRHIIINEKIMIRHKKLIDNIKKLYEKFKNRSIMYLSKKYDFAPLMIIRQFLKYNGYNKQKIKNMLKDPEKITDKKLRNDVIFIKENELDIFTQVDKSDSEKNAIEFEKQIGKFLSKYSIKFKTQEDLAQEQIIKYGKAINTPDFLIISKFTINGKQINWIDAKNFYGAKSWFIKFSLEKQIKKYIKEWGFGAIVFSQGVSSELKINNDNVILIDYDSLDNAK